MTRKIKSSAKCPDCGADVQTMTPFSQWMCKLKYPLSSRNFDSENLDYIWFHYREGWLVTIEEKRYGARSTSAQQDTHNIVAQMLERSSGERFKTWRGTRPIEYRGHYIIRFSKTTPDDSEWITINNKASKVADLLYLLEFGKLGIGEV